MLLKFLNGLTKDLKDFQINPDLVYMLFKK